MRLSWGCDKNFGDKQGKSANDTDHSALFSSLAGNSVYTTCEEILMINLSTINLNYFQFTPNIYQQKNCPAEGLTIRFVVETELSFKSLKSLKIAGIQTKVKLPKHFADYSR